MTNEQTCEVCGKPATRVVHEVDNIPDDAFWCIEAEGDPPWYFCDEHAGGSGQQYPEKQCEP